MTLSLNFVSTSSTTNMLCVFVTGVEELNVNALYAISLLGIVGILKSAPLLILFSNSLFTESSTNTTELHFIPPGVPNIGLYLFPFKMNPSSEYLS